MRWVAAYVNPTLGNLLNGTLPDTRMKDRTLPIAQGACSARTYLALSSVFRANFRCSGMKSLTSRSSYSQTTLMKTHDKTIIFVDAEIDIVSQDWMVRLLVVMLVIAIYWGNADARMEVVEIVVPSV